jgi:hypothetical protein
MEGLLSLALLAGASGGLLLATRKARQAQKDAFEDIVNPAVARAYPPAHIEFTRQGAQKYNPIMNLMNPQNITLPADFSSSELTSMEKQIKESVQTLKANPDDPSFMLAKASTANIQLSPLGKGTKGIQVCEKVKSLDCNSFDNQEFADTCGMCHDQGVNSQNQSIVGGLFVSSDAKANAEAIAKREGSRTVKYTPTVGKCAPGRFSTNKEQCQRIQKEMECEKKQNFSQEGCSQCVQDESFMYLSPDLMQNSPLLVLSGSGKVTITSPGNQFPLTQTLTETNVGSFGLGEIKEGDIVTIEVSAENGKTPTVSGYLIGTTVGGDYRVDIIRLIQVDTVTGAKPRLVGNLSINGDMYSLLRSGAGKNTMKLQLLNTFTFLSASEAEAQRCGSAPFITKESSAKFLESSVCYAKGQTPGNYSLNCLQQTFLGAGCTEEGEAFPADETKARAMSTDAKGTNLSIGAIADSIYQKAQVAYTGRDAAGNKIPIPDWDKVSRFCTGKPIVSPCDYDNQETGPLSKECLSYLWTNSGANTTNLGPGPTYTGSQLIRSLNQQNKDRFCTPSGSMAPVDTNGNETAAAAIARAKGGVKAVKEFYNQISLKANDNTLTDAQRKEAVQQCYGVEFSKQQTVPIAGVPQGNFCAPITIVPGITNPTGARNYGTHTIRDNSILTFTLIPTEAAHPEHFSQIFRFTKTLTDSPNDDGSRMPAVYMFPRTLRLHISYFYKGMNISINTSNPLPLNTETNIILRVNQQSMSLECTGGLSEKHTVGFPSPPPTGQCTLYIPTSVDAGFPTFKGTLRNLSLCSNDSPYPSVLDNRPGRTKTAFLKQTNYFFRKNTANVVELGNYGIPPWGKTWGGAFPDDGQAKWIWSRAGADASNPVEMVGFVYTYMNNTDNDIQASFVANTDNDFALFVNHSFLNQGPSGVRTTNIVLKPGDNLIELFVSNIGAGPNPAGVIAICRNSQTSSVLFRTNKDWKYVIP